MSSDCLTENNLLTLLDQEGPGALLSALASLPSDINASGILLKAIIQNHLHLVHPLLKFQHDPDDYKHAVRLIAERHNQAALDHILSDASTRFSSWISNTGFKERPFLHDVWGQACRGAVNAADLPLLTHIITNYCIPAHAPVDNHMLALAAGRGNKEVVLFLLNHCDPNHSSGAALIEAVSQDDMDIVDVLLPLTDTRNFSGYTGLTAAINMNDNPIPMLEKLLPHYAQEEICQALASAVYNKDQDVWDVIYPFCDPIRTLDILSSSPAPDAWDKFAAFHARKVHQHISDNVCSDPSMSTRSKKM